MTSFTHIHCSSRFDRSAASLESDLDDWMKISDLITVTEVNNDRRAAKLAEKGWNYFNSKRDNNSDNVGIAWDTGIWTKKKTSVRQLENVRYYTLSHRVSPHVYAANVLLKNREAGDKLLVSLAHMPAHIGGTSGFAPTAGHDQTQQEFRLRKQAYTMAMTTWSSSVKQLQASWKPDCTLVVADWNLNLKWKWVHTYLHDHWGQLKLKLAWQNFPTLPTSPASIDSIIDGSLYGGMKVTDGPHIMSVVKSSDHRPYNEQFDLGRWDNSDWQASGSTEGDPWWGFGDTNQDELFVPDITVGEGEAGGEVL